MGKAGKTPKIIGRGSYFLAADLSGLQVGSRDVARMAGWKRGGNRETLKKNRRAMLGDQGKNHVVSKEKRQIHHVLSGRKSLIKIVDL